MSLKNSKTILVAGPTSYVGGRLVPGLLEAGYTVRAMGRSLEKLACRPWGRHPNVELVKGDVLDRESLERALSGCGAAYYLVHLEMLSCFLPKGLWGMIYCYTLYPLHEKIFFGMLKKMAKAIEKPIVSGPERFTPRLHDSCALR